jgi:transposase
VDVELEHADAAIAAALEGWPERDRAVLPSLPGVAMLRQAVLLSTIGDWRTFESDRQLRKLLGWYPEALESGTSVSKHRLGDKGNRLARREMWLWVMGLLTPAASPNPFRSY